MKDYKITPRTIKKLEKILSEALLMVDRNHAGEVEINCVSIEIDDGVVLLTINGCYTIYQNIGGAIYKEFNMIINKWDYKFIMGRFYEMACRRNSLDI